MKIFKEIAPLKACLHEIRAKGKTIGLVPTMGALHEGHLSLIKKSKLENEVTVCSIYVNPTQFNNAGDLERYPRTLEKDIELLKSVECDLLLVPENDEMYNGISVLKFDFGQLDKVMEGTFRPGHFSGVALVVSKLFNITEPTNAYFGQKDWQQFAIVKQLVKELKYNLALHSVPTVREENGLAMSSRNLRLSQEERSNAGVFYESLLVTKTRLKSGMPFSEAKKIAKHHIESKPGFKLEYLELADSENLNLLSSVGESEKPILCVAGFVREVRLIDNLFI